MTNYPTSKDNFINPTATNTVVQVNHADQHSNANDAIEALQTKVGINGDTNVDSIDFKLSNIPNGEKAPNNQDVVDVQDNLDDHINDTTNPHTVTKTQVGLGNVTDDAQLKRASGDINTFTTKTVVDGSDIVLIEDQTDSFNKKKVTLSSISDYVALNQTDFDVQTYTCGENIAINDAVALIPFTGALNTNVVDFETSDTNRSITPTTWRSQSYTTTATATTINRIRVRFLASTSSIGQVRLIIRSSLTGSNLYDSSGVNLPNTTGQHNITFIPRIPVTGNTTYHLIVIGQDVGGGSISVRTDDTISYGSLNTSTDSGSSWSADTSGRYYFSVDEGYFNKNEIIKTSASSFSSRLNFIGFARESKNIGESCLVNRGNYELLTGLTPGSDYYLSDTSGLISTTPGTIERVAGRAISATLFDRLLNKSRSVSAYQSVTVGFSICFLDLFDQGQNRLLSPGDIISTGTRTVKLLQ
jgi:hypothetical protein